MTRVIAGVLAAFLLVAAAETTTVICDPAVLEAGSPATCFADGYAPEGAVDVRVDGAFSTAVTVTADAAGTASVDLVIPDDVSAGSATISMTGLDAGGEDLLVVAATFEVSPQPAAPEPAPSEPAPPAPQPSPAAPADTPPPSLPETGTEAAVGLTVAIALMLAGAGSLWAARRRTRDR